MSRNEPYAHSSAVPADPAIRADLERFLYAEAAALDSGRFRDWLGLFTPEARYEMPARLNREDSAAPEARARSWIFLDTYDTLSIRIARLESDYAWAERPASRTRHFVTNIEAYSTGQADTYIAHSNCLLIRSRGSATPANIISAAREDTIIGEIGAWRIDHRLITPDEAVIDAHNLSVFF
jgi:3-phenylpropionate/cinnamic acid dioxygenase small subunit